MSDNLVMFAKVCAGLALVAVVAMPIWSRTVLDVTIRENAAARTCVKPSLLREGRRSEVSRFEMLDFCGIVVFESGVTARLPETRALNVFAEKREVLDDMLLEGCSYRVVIAGFGNLEPIVTGQVRETSWTLVDIVEEYGCPEPTSEG